MSRLRDALADLPGAAFADLLESDDAYLVAMDLPGATAATTDVRITGGRVTVEAQREKAAPASFQYTREDRSLFLDVEFPLPPDATSNGARATIDRGVLELELPKTAATTGRSIPISDA